MVLQNAIDITVRRKHVIVNHRMTGNKVQVTLMLAWSQDLGEKIGMKSTCTPVAILMKDM